MNILVWVAVAAQSGTASPVTEANAISRSLERNGLRALWASREAIARSNATAVGLWPNPQVSYEREQVLGAREGVEEALSISQRITRLGRRGKRSEAGDRRVGAAQLDNDASRIALVADVRRRYYDALVWQSRVRVWETLEARLDKALEVVAKREAAGDSSTYDRRRMERELRVTAARLDSARASREAAWLELVAIAGGLDAPSKWPRLAGTLLPQVDAPPSETPTRPDVRALEARADAARLDREAAARSWIPDVGLTAGYRGVADASFGDHGFVAGVSLGVPIFDRGQARYEAADARAKQAEAARALRLAELAARGEVLAYQASSSLDAARRHRTALEVSSRELVRIAKAAYDGGELGLLELLDAYRGDAEDELLVLSLAVRARVARIELDAVLGVTP